MRKSVILATVTALLVTVLPLAANAARVDAAAFAADCNDDGAVTVSGSLRVVGGSGLINTDNCFVSIEADSRLIFRDTKLRCEVGVTCSLVVGNSGENSIIKVIRSTIKMKGALQLSAGCCSGGDSTAPPESNGFVKVVDSVLKGSSVEVSASAATDGGRVVVRRSKLTGTGTGSFRVVIATFAAGQTIAVGNTINSRGDIDVRSGSAVPGTTKARNNEFNAGGTTTITASGGTCVSRGNTPTVPCT